jgi:hypothetical protein
MQREITPRRFRLCVALLPLQKRRTRLREPAFFTWDKPWHETDNAGRPFGYWKKRKALLNSQQSRNN